MLDNLVQKLKAANSVILSTHRNSDGDGLGAQLALFHGLKQLGKQAWVINPDRPAKKYAFLNSDRCIQTSADGPTPSADLAIILDTNDRRLVEPLITEFEKNCKAVLFLDHHPVLKHGPAPSADSVIDVSAASTGEIAFRILQLLGVRLNAEIARALYTSVTFDTQLFRYVKSDPRSHLMAAELLRFEKNPEEVHRFLFATYTADKMSFLARALSTVEYSADGRIALIRVNAADALKSGIEADETGDVIDQVMNIESVEVAALIREDAAQTFKVSLRSKGKLPVLPLAEKLGGGGHLFASGAYVTRNGADLQKTISDELSVLVRGAR